MSDSKKPASKISIYPVTAAIWRNEGPKGAFYSATFERSYKKDGKYQSSDSFGGSDLLILAKVADMAHTEMEKLRANDKQAQPSEE
jgi:hypothetical protein